MIEVFIGFISSSLEGAWPV